METLDQLEYLKKRFYIFLEFYSRKTNQNSENIIINQLKDIFEDAYKKKNIKQLKKLNKELDVWIIEMQPDEKEEINKLFRENLNEDIKESNSKRSNKINMIVKRGKINNKREYEMLLQRVEEIYADDDKKIEVQELNNLLANFHKDNSQHP